MGRTGIDYIITLHRKYLQIHMNTKNVTTLMGFLESVFSRKCLVAHLKIGTDSQKLVHRVCNLFINFEPTLQSFNAVELKKVLI